MRDTSRRSLIICSCACAAFAIASIARVVTCSSSRPERSSCAQPTIELSGLRNSCETVARNSSFRRFASSALRRRVCSWASRRFWSEMSLATFDAAMTLSLASLTGETVSDISNRRPSFALEVVNLLASSYLSQDVVLFRMTLERDN
jgi:hypothetical protein